MSSQVTQQAIAWKWVTIIIAFLMLGTIICLMTGHEDQAELLIMVIILILSHVFGFEIGKIKVQSKFLEAKVNTSMLKAIGYIIIAFLVGIMLVCIFDGLLYVAIFSIIALGFVTYWTFRVIRI